MIHLHLDSTDAEVLRDVLRTDVSELTDEIAKTDSHDYRDRLKQKRAVLERLATSLDIH